MQHVKSVHILTLVTKMVSQYDNKGTADRQLENLKPSFVKPLEP